MYKIGITASQIFSSSSLLDIILQSDGLWYLVKLVLFNCLGFPWGSRFVICFKRSLSS
jgi:hypothetical protein